MNLGRTISATLRRAAAVLPEEPQRAEELLKEALTKLNYRFRVQRKFEGAPIEERSLEQVMDDIGVGCQFTSIIPIGHGEDFAWEPEGQVEEQHTYGVPGSIE